LRIVQYLCNPGSRTHFREVSLTIGPKSSHVILSREAAFNMLPDISTLCYHFNQQVMKNYLMTLTACTFVALTISCSEDEPKKENEINHVGEKWKINSVEYNIIDQNLTNPSQAVKNGTATDAGAFYFDGAKGSFDITIDGIHKEDVFSFQQDANSINITSIAQSVSGASVSQNVIVISGEKNTSTTMSLNGTITKQSLAGQFVMTATFSLVKE